MRLYSAQENTQRWQDCRPTLYQWEENAVKQTIRLWDEDITRPVYCWYKPSNGSEWGGFQVGLDAPGPEWILASTSRLSISHRDFDHLRATLHQILWSIPVLPTH